MESKNKLIKDNTAINQEMLFNISFLYEIYFRLCSIMWCSALLWISNEDSPGLMKVSYFLFFATLLFCSFFLKLYFEHTLSLSQFFMI